MTDERTGGTPLTDAALIRYLDGELEPETASRIAAAPESAARLTLLQRRARHLSALLAELDPEEDRVAASARAIRPRLRRGVRAPVVAWLPRRPLMRAAAAILLLLAGTLAVPSARAWMVERARDVAQALGVDPEAPPEASPAATQPNESTVAGFGVSFTVAADTFDLYAVAAPGRLVVRHTAEASGSVEAARAPGASYAVLPDGLRIENGPVTGAVYLLRLPAHVRAVRVRLGDAAPVTYALPANGELEIALQFSESG